MLYICLYQVCAFNRTVSKVDEFLANEAKGTRVIGAHSLEEMVQRLKKPRRVMMLVKAGDAVDDFINKLVRLMLIFGLNFIQLAMFSKLRKQDVKMRIANYPCTNQKSTTCHTYLY